MGRLLCGLLLAATAGAQPWTTNGLTIPGTHPRLWWNSSRISQAQTWMAANPFTPNTSYCSSSTLNSQCMDIAMKHLLSGAYTCQPAIDYVMGSSCPGTRCTSSAAGSDFARQQGEIFMSVYDWCHDQVTTSDASTTVSGAISASSVNTTISAVSSPYAGTVTVTPASMAGISVGTQLVVNPSGTLDQVEQAAVTATTATTFTIKFAKAVHSAGAVLVSAQAITPVSMSGIYLWQPLTVDGESVWVTAITGSTFSAAFLSSHSGGAAVSGPSMQSRFLTNWNAWMTGVNQQVYGGPDYPATENNYYWGQLRNGYEYGMVSYGENGTGAGSYPKQFLDDGDYRYSRFKSDAAKIAGGIAAEGPDYGVSISSYPMIPAQSAALMGRNWAEESAFYKQVIFGLIYATSPAPTWNKYDSTSSYTLFPFSDDSFTGNGAGTVLAGRNYFQNFANWASNYYASSAATVSQYARLWHNTVTANSKTLAVDRFVKAVDSSPSAAAGYSSLPLDYYATAQQYLYGRTAWNTTGTVFQWQLGTGRGIGDHFHYDYGNFQIWRNGRWLTREASGYSAAVLYMGYGLRTLGTGTTDPQRNFAHNVVTFSTPYYTDQVNFSPSVPRGNPVVRRLESTTDYAYAATDLTDSYIWADAFPQYNYGGIGHIERELIYVRPLETTVVLDRMTTTNVTSGIDSGTTAANEVNTFMIHFETNPTLEDATHLTATNGTQALRMTTLVPSSPTRRVVNEADCSSIGKSCSNRGLYRVEIDTSGAAQRYFLHVLQARDSTGSNITASVVDSNPASTTSGTFTVTLHPSVGSDTVIVFDKGATSANGTISVAGAATVALRADAAQVTYNDSGIVWDSPTYGIAQTSPLPDAAVGIAYSRQLTTSGGTGPYTWSVLSGSLPNGLSMSSSGLISGTPTTLGDSSFTIRAVDNGAAQTADKDFTLAVINPTLAVTSIPDLPGGAISVPYSTTLQAIGGAPPYSWSVTGGTVCAGLSLSTSGTLSGAPTVTGQCTFTATVTDTASGSASQAFTLSIPSGTGTALRGVAGRAVRAGR